MGLGRLAGLSGSCPLTCPSPGLQVGPLRGAQLPRPHVRGGEGRLPQLLRLGSPQCARAVAPQGAQLLLVPPGDVRPTGAIKILQAECWPALEYFLGRSLAGDPNPAGGSLAERSQPTPSALKAELERPQPQGHKRAPESRAQPGRLLLPREGLGKRGEREGRGGGELGASLWTGSLQDVRSALGLG